MPSFSIARLWVGGSLMIVGLALIAVMSTAAIRPPQECRASISEKVAQIVRDKFPDDMHADGRRRGRTMYSIEHRRRNFDLDRDGYLSLNEYTSYEWSVYLAYASPGTCKVTKAEFFNGILGFKTDPVSGWSLPYQVQAAESLYRKMDVRGRGYITRADIVPRARRSFEFSDKDKDGRLSVAELK